MKKIILLACLLILNALSTIIKAQNEDIDSLFREFGSLYSSGDIVNAEETLLLILKSEETLDESYLTAVYNNLGVINQLSGKYDKAIGFYDKAEALVTGKEQNLKELADIYSNKGNIFSITRSYDISIGYFERSIRIYNDLELQDNSVLASLSSAFLNTGIAFLNIEDYRSALDYFNKSLEIKVKNNFSGIALVYLNIAKTWVKLHNTGQPEVYFLKSIEKFTDEFDANYYRLAEVFFDYGLFLDSEGRDSESLAAYNRALSICLGNYGEKHTLVALSYKHLGDHYFNQSDYFTALEYFQKSLISVVKDFNDTDIYSNPSIDSSLFDIRLLGNLKSKAQALELFGLEQDDRTNELKIINKSLETIDLALQLINRIRSSYPTEESRLYLSEYEKETYLFAIHIAGTLYNLTGDISISEKMYSIAQSAKAAILRNEITENESFYSAGIPDSLREKRNRLTGNIATYKNLILDESGNSNPDNSKIALWKDAIFSMTREIGKLNGEINTDYPQYSDLLQKTEPVSLTGIQKNLRRDETIIDYIISSQYKEGRRDLFIFLITRDDIKFVRTILDSVFLSNAEIIRNIDLASNTNKFREYTNALGYMYEKLVSPVEGFFVGNKLIVIPDEEIVWLPFDAFLTGSAGPEQTNYDGLKYLIHKYTISYSYSSSLISGKKDRIRRGSKVYAFSPEYNDGNFSNPAVDRLQGAAQETESIYRWFKGRKFMHEQAAEANFMEVISHPAMFHLAMHSVSDTTNSKYSYLLFDTRSDTIEDGRLYNYEISLARMKSPMVVLSACNSGTGTLYHGEGLMSLARGFILAGASSVIRTSWEVNDETSATIISRFYYYLSKGKYKDEAMRQAKLNYLKATSPAFTSPYFWAAYEILGDNTPVAVNENLVILLIIICLIIFLLILSLYFRRRRIFAERSS